MSTAIPIIRQDGEGEQMWFAGGGTFTGTCLAIWDLTRDYWDPSNLSPDYSRGDGCDGGNAADIPIAPTLITLQELNAALPDGFIHHALRFTMQNNRIRSTAYVHPATHYGFGGTTGGPDTLPTGARCPAPRRRARSCTCSNTRSRAASTRTGSTGRTDRPFP